jgi:hypothetical protein
MPGFRDVISDHCHEWGDPRRIYRKNIKNNFMKDYFLTDFENYRDKYRKLNPLGEDMYLRPDGTIEKDIDKIIFIQRWWVDRLYRDRDGIFYKKMLLNYKNADD